MGKSATKNCYLQVITCDIICYSQNDIFLNRFHISVHVILYNVATSRDFSDILRLSMSTMNSKIHGVLNEKIFSVTFSWLMIDYRNL